MRKRFVILISIQWTVYIMKKLRSRIANIRFNKIAVTELFLYIAKCVFQGCSKIVCHV